MSGTRVHTVVLLTELAKRGWTASDLARAAGVSAATVSAAVRGRRISARTLRRFAEALHRQPEVPGAEALVLVDAAGLQSSAARTFMSAS